jgi:chromosomal replication initiation ATPase DnaA
MANAWVKQDCGNFHCGYNPEFVAKVYAKRREANRKKKEAELQRMKVRSERQRQEDAERRAKERMQREREEIEAQRERFECMARRAKDTIKAKENGLPSVTQIIMECALKYNIEPTDIIEKSRYYPIKEARFDAMARAYVERPDLSLNQIGKHFKRDHTSVLHAVKVRGVWRNPGRTYESKDAA